MLVAALLLTACRQAKAPPPPELFAETPAPTAPAVTGEPEQAAPQQAGAGQADAATAGATTTAATAGGSAPQQAPDDGEAGATAAAAEADVGAQADPQPAERVLVASILVGWRGSLPDPRISRDEAAAEAESARLLARAEADGADFFALLWEHSDDPGDGVYRIDAEHSGRYATPLVKQALRMAVGERARVRTRFGWHVLLRLPDDAATPPRPARDRCGPCPQPGEQASTCVRRPEVTPAEVEVASILVGWRGAPGGRGPARSRDEAETLARELCHGARLDPGAFAALRDRHSDDPGTGRYVVRPGSALAESFRRMALGMSEGNIAMVETPFGWHILRRIR